MAVDFAEKEREFLDSLAGDTGRDLAQWMEAITASDLQDRNAIIDWLRRQGFLFAKASWLERIHHNGGRPIYADLTAARVSAAPPQKTPGPAEPPQRAEPPPPAPPRALSQPPAVAASPPPAVPPSPPPAAAASPPPAAVPAALDVLLAEAKAYRPLAQFVLREIQNQVDGVRLDACPGYVALSRQTEFAALTIAPRELRLALALGSQPAPDPFVKARFAKTHPGMPPRLTHMVVLTDARQVTPELLAVVRAAALQEAC